MIFGNTHRLRVARQRLDAKYPHVFYWDNASIDERGTLRFAVNWFTKPIEHPLGGTYRRIYGYSNS